MTDPSATRFPWEPAPSRDAPDIIAALQRDFAYAVRTTAVIVRSNNPAFATVVNTERGQIVPRGEVKFTDGTTVELQDIGMCQPNVPEMTVHDVMARVWTLATELGMELVP